MNPDEFEYFFELDELEPFANTPVTELTKWITPEPARNDKPAPEPHVIAPARSAGSAASAVPSTTDTSQPEKSPSRNASPVTATAQDAPPPAGAIPNDASASETASRNDFVHWQDRMSVHVLGQFAFCNRAGIYSAENGDETDLDDPSPQWGYLPNFDLERIEEELAKLLRLFWMLLLLMFVLISAMIGGVAVRDRRLFYPAFAGALACSATLMNIGGMIFTLIRRCAAARRAEMREPDPRIERIEPVNWWSMLKAGFEPVPYQRQFRHPRLALEGCPWRVLERGSLRIPVIKSGGDKLGDAKHTIYPKHELRLAAYAVLLEATEHVDVPYGVIFPADSHLGLAMPITRTMRDQVAEQLDHASDLLLRSQRGESEPRPPHDRKRCATCRLGEPIPISDREISSAKKTRTPLLILQDTSGCKYQCACGDRFRFAPPHGRIIQLGLTSVVE